MLAHLQGFYGFLNADFSSTQKTVGTLARGAVHKVSAQFGRMTTTQGDGNNGGKSESFKNKLSFLQSSVLKTSLNDFLKNGDGPNDKIFEGNFNIYLPSTLTSGSFNSSDYYYLNHNKKDLFVIYMMIVQSKFGSSRCVGTHKLGEERGLLSGKKYNPDNYYKAIKGGVNAITNENKDSLLNLLVHNSGGKKDNTNKFLKSYIYTNDNITFDSDSFDTSKIEWNNTEIKKILEDIKTNKYPSEKK